MKKIICSFLIFSILLQSACTTLETIQKDEIDDSITDENIIVILNDSTEYKFKSNEFTVLEDTIYHCYKYDWGIEYIPTILFEDISEIKIIKYDDEKTVLLIIVLAGLAAIIYTLNWGLILNPWN